MASHPNLHLINRFAQLARVTDKPHEYFEFKTGLDWVQCKTTPSFDTRVEWRECERSVVVNGIKLRAAIGYIEEFKANGGGWLASLIEEPKQLDKSLAASHKNYITDLIRKGFLFYTSKDASAFVEALLRPIK